jgi:hypothetical protein
MRDAFDSIKKIPHPEEAAKQLSRRTHGADPADRQFPDSLDISITRSAANGAITAIATSSPT